LFPRSILPVRANTREQVVLVIRGGTVITMDGKGSVLENEAVAVHGGKIVAIGTNADISARYQTAESFQPGVGWPVNATENKMSCRASENSHFAVGRELSGTPEKQNQDNKDKQSSTRIVAPAAGVGPRWQTANEQED